MSGISDEMLMAYVDGELDDGGRAAIEAYLATAPGADERLRIFEATGRGLSDLFDQPMREPVPQRLIDIVNAPDKVVAFGRVASRRQQSSIAWPTALAASLTMLAAAGSAYWFAAHRGGSAGAGFGVAVASNGDRVAAHAVAAVLDTVASGTTASAAVDGQNAAIKPVFTFSTENSGFCRQYTITAPDALAYGGVACKAPTGNWRVEAYEALEAKQGASDGKIAPAAGNAGPKSVEDAVDRLIYGDVLGAEAERAAIARGWRPGDKHE